MSNYKNDILSVETFLENRPDLNVHEDDAIQSAIYASCAMLNSETNGLMEKVWYVTDTTNELYRDDDEKASIVEALTVQTHFTINIGNDISQGSSSFSMGNINYSGSRSIDRDTIAPGVIKLLNNARIYQFQIFGTNKKAKATGTDTTNYVTYEKGDIRYLKVQQPIAKKGNIPYVDDNNNISFGSPQDLDISTYNTTNIKNWNNNDYSPIDKIKDLAFFGKNLTGFQSAVERGEIEDLIANISPIFSSGEKVGDVKYLGTINQDNIKTKASLNDNNFFMGMNSFLGKIIIKTGGNVLTGIIQSVNDKESILSGKWLLNENPESDLSITSKIYVDDADKLKQNTLTAGDNITIVNDVISSTGGSGDVTLAGDNPFTGKNSFTKTISIIAPGGTTAGTISSASATSAVLGGNWRIGTIPNNLYSIANKKYVDTKASLTNTQTFTGGNSFNNTLNLKGKDTSLKFINSLACYLAWYENDGRTRIAYFGKGSSGSNVISIGGDESLKIEMEKGLDMNGKWLYNLPAPHSPSDATTKKYVDDKNTLQDTDIETNTSDIKKINDEPANPQIETNKKGITDNGILIENNKKEIALRASLTNSNDLDGINTFKQTVRARDGIDCYNQSIKRVADGILDTDGINKGQLDNAYKIEGAIGVETMVKGRFFNGKQIYEKTITTSLISKPVAITTGSAAIIGAIILLTRKSDNYQFVQVPSTLNNSEVYRKPGGSIEYWGSTSDKYKDERTITTSYTK